MFDDKPTDNAMDFSKGKLKAAPGPMAQLQASDPVRRTSADLDTPAAMELHGRLLSFYRQELDRQEVNRAEMAMDEDFYDNDQWSDDDKATLKDRGQVALVYNVIATSVNWVIGTEKRGRTEFKVLPRRKDGSKAAERKTQLLKYLNDVNRTPFHKSRAFEDAVKVGIGWLECGVQDDDDGEPTYERYESWRNVLWDSAATEMDLSDGRYQFRSKWVDLDIALAMFPNRASELRIAAVDADRYTKFTEHGDEPMDAQEDSLDTIGTSEDGNSFRRMRVRLIEGWYRNPVPTERLRGGDFSGDMFEAESPAHRHAIDAGESTIVNKITMRMHVAVMTTRDMLHISRSPYRHNSFPMTPVWAYRRGRDGLPYGMIRGMRDIQEDINKRASKALHILSTSKTIMDKGAVDDLDAFMEEVSRPDAVIIKKAGAFLEINADRDLAPAHLELMSRSISMLQSQSGVTDEMMGRTTNAKSGVAIQARQNQGSMGTAKLFDNLRLAWQIHGEKALSLVEQYFTEAKSFRITNMRGSAEYVTINDGEPHNDITKTKADFIISEDDWRASVRAAQAEELINLMMQLAPVAPQVILVMLDLVIETMDVPNRDELVKRIRQVTGMSDPDDEEVSPEQQAKAAEAAEQAAMQKELLQATIAEKQAGATAKAASSDLAKANAQKILSAMAGQNVATQAAALEAAIILLTAPPAVTVADGILKEAGFVSATEMADAVQQQASAQAAIQQQADQGGNGFSLSKSGQPQGGGQGGLPADQQPVQPPDGQQMQPEQGPQPEPPPAPPQGQ